MREKTGKIFINIIAFICLCIFVLARFDSFPGLFADRDIIESEAKGIYGDLFYMCRVDYFKILLPEFVEFFKNSEKNSDIHEADMLIFGDSYFAGSRVIKTFPELIKDSLKVKVHFETESLPLKSLAKYNYVNSTDKILLYEATERRILEDFKNVHGESSVEKVFISNMLNTISPFNIELKYQYILQKSLLSSKIYSFLMNTRFDLFGIISDITPVFSKNPPFLFYYQNVNDKNTSFYYRFTESEISKTADNIAGLAHTLKNNYNLDFVFMPIPSSYTINHNIINNDRYNQFLPVLTSELKKRNITVVDVYGRFKNSDKLLYYPTDTHWNPEGMLIAFDEFMKTIEKFKANRNNR